MCDIRLPRVIAALLDRVNHPELMGVCLDTCHVHDGGYEIVENLDAVLDTFDQIIGLEKLSDRPCLKDPAYIISTRTEDLNQTEQRLMDALPALLAKKERDAFC